MRALTIAVAAVALGTTPDASSSSPKTCALHSHDISAAQIAQYRRDGECPSARPLVFARSHLPPPALRPHVPTPTPTCETLCPRLLVLLAQS